MTYQPEGTIAGRQFTAVRKKGETRMLRCLECGAETKPDPQIFAKHECAPRESAKAKKTATATGKGS
ncbi:MAG TPA: hypothetical protein VFI91_13265 [Longimicrobiaceae bacterium]|nr:hypothetical protein [Longimicrobiaceae bacterium]